MKCIRKTYVPIFVSLHLSPDCKDLDARLYIEVGDGIGRKQIDLLLENLLVQKPLEKLWDQEDTLKCLFFLFCFVFVFFDSLFTIVFSTDGRYPAVIEIL